MLQKQKKNKKKTKKNIKQQQQSWINELFAHTKLVHFANSISWSFAWKCCCTTCCFCSLANIVVVFVIVTSEKKINFFFWLYKTIRQEKKKSQSSTMPYNDKEIVTKAYSWSLPSLVISIINVISNVNVVVKASKM